MSYKWKWEKICGGGSVKKYLEKNLKYKNIWGEVREKDQMLRGSVKNKNMQLGVNDFFHSAPPPAQDYFEYTSPL